MMKNTRMKRLKRAVWREARHTWNGTMREIAEKCMTTRTTMTTAVTAPKPLHHNDFADCDAIWRSPDKGKKTKKKQRNKENKHKTNKQKKKKRLPDWNLI